MGREVVEAARLLGVSLPAEEDSRRGTEVKEEESHGWESSFRQHKEVEKTHKFVDKVPRENPLQVDVVVKLEELENVDLGKDKAQQKESIAEVKPPQKMTMHEAAVLLGGIDPKKREDKVKLDITEDTNVLEPKDMAKPAITDSSDDSEGSDDESETEVLFDDETKPLSRLFKNGKPKKDPTNKGFPCSSCIISYSTNKGLMRHMLNEHDTPLKCDKCDEQFTEAFNLKTHNQKNHQKLLVCLVCGVQKTKQYYLDQHIEAEHQDNIECHQCGILCRTQTLLSSHIDRAHSEKVFDKCVKCDYTTHIPREMKAHFYRRHTNGTKETCQYCGEVFKGLRKHLARTGCGGEVNTKKVTCSSCNKVFSLKQALDNHMKNIHMNVKDKHCPHCSYATYSGYNLKLHVTKMHLGKEVEKKTCPYCPKVTTNIDYHINIMHNEHFVAKNSY